jgi:hypothetical protein
VIPIRTKNDLAELLAQPRAFVFLWVYWAIHARLSQKVVGEVVESWNATNPDASAPCYIIDLSDQCGEIWDAVAEWLTGEGRTTERLMMCGVGPLLWVTAGHVVAEVLNPNQFGANKLIAATRSIWIYGNAKIERR